MGSGQGKFYFLVLRVDGLRPREIVVDNFFTISIAHLQPSRHGTHPSHVDITGQDAEMIEGGGGDDKNEITGHILMRHESDRDIIPVLR